MSSFLFHEYNILLHSFWLCRKDQVREKRAMEELVTICFKNFQEKGV